jgi:hypothetical protein
MNKEIAERLREMAAMLESQIAVTQKYGLKDTAMLLRMAKLDVELKIHGISEGELRALTDALEARRPEPAEPSGAAVIDLMTRKARKRR